jgi:SAM-dependent methyltransferase
MLKIAAVRDAYPPSMNVRWRVLEVGSMSYSDHDTYRNLFSEGSYEYIGLDIVPGPNVDVVPADPYSWDELESESFDLVISGQAFEHNPYFWIPCAEVSRVLKVGGLTAIIAPSAGGQHRCRFDCWSGGHPTETARSLWPRGQDFPCLVPANCAARRLALLHVLLRTDPAQPQETTKLTVPMATQ